MITLDDAPPMLATGTDIKQVFEFAKAALGKHKGVVELVFDNGKLAYVGQSTMLSDFVAQAIALGVATVDPVH